MKVAILQSNYIPWKGYFDIINDVDMFVFYDEVQYTKRDWRNRNKIYMNNGLAWLTVPVLNSGEYEQRIIDAKIENPSWQKKHFQTLQCNYSRAPYYKKYSDFLHYVYCEKEWEYLYQLNRYMTEYISRKILKSSTVFADSLDYKTEGVKHDKLLNLVKAVGADVYLSGPAAKDYIVAADYADAGIKLLWKDYTGYPEYKQLHAPFEHGVSILDLLFNTGDDAPEYIWGWRNKSE